jgi:hypothetical protein
MADNEIRGIISSRESFMHAAFENTIHVQYRRQYLPLGPSDMILRGQILWRYIPTPWGRACTSRAFDGEEGTAGSMVGRGC